MKRYLAVFLSVLLLLPVMVLPVLADEGEVYEFHYVDSVMLSDDYEFEGDGDIAYYLDCLLPDGTYVVHLNDEYNTVFTVDYFDSSPESFGFDVSYPTGDLHFAMEEIADGLVLYVEIGTLSSSSITFVPFSSVSSKEPFTFVSADMLNVVLDQIYGLLPIALVVVVGFISLRKGIAFVRRFLESA